MAGKTLTVRSAAGLKVAGGIPGHLRFPADAPDGTADSLTPVLAAHAFDGT
jgi:hypothetical protein